MASGEKWDLLNFVGQYKCFKKAFGVAKYRALRKQVPIMVRHHGPHHLEDDTRVNQYVHPDGRRDIRRDDAGKAIDAP